MMWTAKSLSVTPGFASIARSVCSSLQKFAAEVVNAPVLQRAAAAPEPVPESTWWTRASGFIQTWGLPLAGAAVAAVLVFAVAAGPPRVTSGNTAAMARANGTSRAEVIGTWARSFAAEGCSSGEIQYTLQNDGGFSIRATASGCTTAAEQQNPSEITGHWKLTPEDGSSDFWARFKPNTRIVLQPDSGNEESYHLDVTEKGGRPTLEFGNSDERVGMSSPAPGQKLTARQSFGDYDRVEPRSPQN